MADFIPLSVPNLAGNEWKYIKECLDTNWVSSVGSYVDKFEQDFARFTGAKYAVSVVNGTAALHIALRLAGVTTNDLVIVPNITFVASLNAITYCRAEPLLIDVHPKTWQLDTDLLQELLATQTYSKDGQLYHTTTHQRIRAIMPVHVLGNMCDMPTIMAVAQQYNLVVLEDATEALGSAYQGKQAGTWGLLGCSSFNGNKIITTGGGGMIMTNDEALAKKAKHLTTQAKSDAFEYIHDEIGYNYRLVNILAAMGVAQLEQILRFLQRKREINTFYRASLQNIAGLQFQEIPTEITCNYWLFTVMHPQQKGLIQHLLKHKIQVRPLWLPMNRLQMFQKNLYYTHKDNSWRIYEKSISLPCSSNITDEELDRVVETIKSFER
jgi:aminotransferase in exopolysaccharide biosynthesis